ncbi:MAG TPA: low molecular weight protein-tyrosine-phosphatase [Alphaproteobacteria bacterium]|nr:low molecular weight protein-tyrosine-phosphatase [Alphaproteobacteria bacterium]
MRVLFVDAGNFSRSPAAEVVTRKLLADRGLHRHVSVGSAGLKDKHVGDPPDPRTVAACSAEGLDLSYFRCRQIGAGDFREADLILAMDRETLAALETLRPEGATVRLDLFLAAAGGGDVPDPYYGGPEGFEQMMALIRRGAAALAEALAQASTA